MPSLERLVENIDVDKVQNNAMNTPRALLVEQDCRKSKNDRINNIHSQRNVRDLTLSQKKYLEKREPELQIYSSSMKTERKDGRKCFIEAATILAFLYFVLQSSLILNLKF